MSLRVPRWIIAAALLCVAQASATTGPWLSHLPAFSVEAPARGDSPILLYFTAPWCGFCKQMERTTLAEPEVVAALGRLRAHKIDHDAQRGLVERFGVRGIPVLVLTNDRGEVIDRLTGAVAKETLLRWLAAGEEEAKRREQSALERMQALAERYRLMFSQDSAERQAALTHFWERLARGDDMEKEAAASAFRTLRAESPRHSGERWLFWLSGLGHPDLAVRVAAAKLLREERPEDAKFYDPWAEEPVREAAIAVLAKGWGG